MSLREQIFQAAIAAMQGAGLTVLPRRTVPSADDSLPLVMVYAGDTRRSKIAYNLVSNRLTLTIISVGETVAEVEDSAATALAALAADTALADLIDSADIGSISEEVELLAHNITHQRIEYELSYETDAITY